MTPTSTSPTSSSSSSSLAERFASAQSRIREAARAAGRSPHELSLIVVTKNHPAQLVRELADLGVQDVAENRHQEAAEKSAELADLGLRWHFVGQLQTNKARAVTQYSRVIHSVDRPRLVNALDAVGESVEVFLQLNLTEDPARGGCRPEQLTELTEQAAAATHLRVRGVMAVAPLGEEPRAAFARLRSYSDRVREILPDATAISAGMSHDFEAAIAEGATHLRIGAAITGNRPLGD